MFLIQKKKKIYVIELPEKFLQKTLVKNIIKIKSTFSHYDIKVYLAPIPKCVYKKNVYAKLYQDIIDNDLYFLEKKYFNDFSHLTLSGAIKNSFIFLIGS